MTRQQALVVLGLTESDLTENLDLQQLLLTKCNGQVSMHSNTDGQPGSGQYKSHKVSNMHVLLDGVHRL